MTGEFAAIDRISSLLPGPVDPGEVWLGDDAAVVRSRSGWLLLAADTVVAGVHADLTLTGLDDLGWKALAASVSDIAAMGGEPGHALVTVSGPPGTDLDALYEGIRAAAGEFDCPVVGGDLTNAGQVVVTVAVTGNCDGPPVLRRGAQPGDWIWVTGPLGASAAGLRLLRSGAAGSGPVARGGSVARGGVVARAGVVARGGAPPEGGTGPELDRATVAELVRAHARPMALVGHGRAARRSGATAMIDLSDGLAADLGHIATASGVGLALESVPVHPGATLEDALGGGEDYALVFCAPGPGGVAAAFASLDTPIMIGRCTDDPAQRTLGGESLPATGWEHSW